MYVAFAFTQSCATHRSVVPGRIDQSEAACSSALLISSDDFRWHDPCHMPYPTEMNSLNCRHKRSVLLRGTERGLLLCGSVCIPLTLHGTALEEGGIESATTVPSPTHKPKSGKLKGRVPQDRFRRSASVNGVRESSLLNWHSALSISSCRTTEVEKSCISSFHISHS